MKLKTKKLLGRSITSCTIRTSGYDSGVGNGHLSAIITVGLTRSEAEIAYDKNPKNLPYITFDISIPLEGYGFVLHACRLSYEVKSGGFFGEHAQIAKCEPIWREILGQYLTAVQQGITSCHDCLSALRFCFGEIEIGDAQSYDRAKTMARQSLAEKLQSLTEHAQKAMTPVISD
jgi:hypothetical protein